jgi:hypothetical protein
MNLLKALVTVSGMTMVSRVFGFVRDAVVARVFGAGLYTDAFFVAFRLPNLLRRVFAEGAFSQAFVPILAEYKMRRGDADAHDLVDHVASLLALALFIVTALGILAAPLIIYLTAPGFSAVPEKFDLTVRLLRITFPYILFISLTSLAGGILNTLRPLRDPGVHAHPAESRVHRFRTVGCPLVPSAGTGARLGRARRRRAAARLPGALSRTPGSAAAVSVELTRPRCLARRQADGAGHLRRLDRPDQPADQHDLRFVPGDRQRLLAVLRRSADGVPDRCAGRGARDHSVAEPVEKLCRENRRRILRDCWIGACG